MTGMKAERAGQPPAPAQRGERLLVVDDDPDVRDSLKRDLRCACYAVTTAVHGADALDALTRAPVDLIVLDVLMPTVDRFDACRRLRARGDATPILVLTARDAVDDRVAGLAAGADDYLVKPFALAELLARGQALLRRSRIGRDVLGYADLTLDGTARRRTRGDRMIELTRTEFGLLELLLRNAEQVISYDVIRERVWGYGEAPASNALQVFVGFLRRKLEDEGGLLAADTAAKQVAAGRHGSYYAVSKLDGVRAMVYTTPLEQGLAVQLAVPLATVDQEVTSVGTTLALLSVIGVALAALAGWAVARAGLAPVGRLAAVAEDVSATGDPGRRVEVHRADELGRLAASFNTMLGALQRSLSAQRQLVSDASHELRTPLTSLRLNAEMLAAGPGLPEPERREVLDRVVAQVAELGQLVASVTELARDESQPGPLGEVELHEVVEASLAGAQRDWPQTVFTAELEPWPVAGGSTDSLQVAVRNLLDNAAKFGP